MAAIRFYTDEHVPSAVVDGLRRRGFDVLTAPENGTLGAPVEDHLASALREGCVLLTQDADFLRLAAGGADRAGVVYARQGTSVGDLVQGAVGRVLSAEEMEGHVEYL